MSDGGAAKPDPGSKPTSPGSAQSKPAASGSRPAHPVAPKPPSSGATPTRPPAAKSGTPPQLQIGNYRVVERIGAGGMGTVYRAIHVDLDREVALKVLPPEMNSNPTMVARFRREAKAAAQLQHENIVQIFDVSEDKNRHFLALEFVRGKDLSDIINQKKLLPVKQAIDILKQATQALDHAFQKGIVHRDIKPSNFLVTHDGRVKLCDMGLALRTDAGEEAKVTRDGTTVGTVDYMSPEQARDSRLADTRSDIYSLGCTLYQMLTGRVPFEEGSIPEKLFKHAQDLPPDPLQFNPEIPSQVLYVLNRMLEKKPEDRYQTPKELLVDLDQLDIDEKKKSADAALQTLAIGIEADEEATEELMLTRPSGRSSMRRRQEEQTRAAALKKWLTLGGSTAAALLLMLVVWFATRKSDAPTPPAGTQPVETGGETPTGGTPPVTTTKIPPTITPGPSDPDPTSNTTSPNVAGKAKPPDSGAMNNSEKSKTVESTEIQPSGAPPVAAPDRVSAADREKIAQELFPPWPTVTIPGAPVILARGVQQSGGVFGTFEAACRKAQSASQKIDIEDVGPFFERSFSINRANIEARPAANERQQSEQRPVVVFDAAADKGKDYFFQAKQSSVVIEGVDFVVNADDLRDSIGLKPFAMFDIVGGDLVLKNCTFTVIGKHAEAVSLVRFEGLRERDPSRQPDQLARLTLERCFARGETLTVITLINGLADVKIIDSLFVGGHSSTMFECLPPVDPTQRPERTLRLIRSTCVTRGDFLYLDGGSQGDVQTKIILLDSIVACAAPNPARKLVRTRNWPDRDGAIAKATLDERSSLYTGWGDNLIYSGVNGRLSAKSPEEWYKAWGIAASDSQLRPDGWPSEDLGDLAFVSLAPFHPAAVSAGLQSRWGSQSIGCDTAVLSGGSPLLHERTFGRLDPPKLLSLDKVLPSFTYDSQKNPQLGSWQAEQGRRRGIPPAQRKPDDQLDPVLELTFDAASGDLGQFLRSQPELPATTIVVVTGSGTYEMTPVQLSGKKSLVLWFQTRERAPLILKPAAGTDQSKALFEVVDGDLIIEGLTLQWQPGAPSRFIRVERGNLTLARCKLDGPLQGNSGFEAISFVGGPQKSVWPNTTPAAGPIHLDFDPAPHERVNVCQLMDSYVGAEARCVRFSGSQGILRIDNCVMVTPGTLGSFEDLDRAAATDFEIAAVVQQSTLVASRSFFEVGEWLAAAVPARPIGFFSRDNLYCDPFDTATGASARSRSNILLRYAGRTLQQGLLNWESEYDGFAFDVHAYLARSDTNVGRQRFEQDWLPVWGRPRILESVVDTRVEKIRTKAAGQKLRDFERDKRFSDLELQPQCEAAKKASHGGAIGADLKRIGL